MSDEKLKVIPVNPALNPVILMSLQISNSVILHPLLSLYSILN